MDGYTLHVRHTVILTLQHRLGFLSTADASSSDGGSPGVVPRQTLPIQEGTNLKVRGVPADSALRNRQSSTLPTQLMTQLLRRKLLVIDLSKPQVLRLTHSCCISKHRFHHLRIEPSRHPVSWPSRPFPRSRALNLPSSSLVRPIHAMAATERDVLPSK